MLSFGIDTAMETDRIYKKYRISLVLIIGIGLTLIAEILRGNDAVNDSADQSKCISLRLIPAGHPFIEYFGRWDFPDSITALHSWPGVYLIAKFSGRRIGIRMADDVNYYNVYIDGKMTKVLHGTEPGAADYILADALAEGPHELRLAKRNIAFGKSFAFLGIWLNQDAELLPPLTDSAPKIEFIGDSFTVAEGNEATLAEMPWDAKMPVTNCETGFAGLVAKHFKAQYHTICRSGIGLVCDWTGDKSIAMPKWYDRTLMESPEPRWNFRRWQPDLVVICLGLNDMSGLKSPDGTIPDENADLFRTEYRHFLTKVRAAYPGTRILLVAAHPDWLKQNVRKVYTTEKAAGRTDIFFSEFDYYPGGYVANGHPTVATHRKIADQIIETIVAEQIFK